MKANPHDRSGFSLIMVLFVVALSTAVLAAFLGSVSLETRSAKQYAKLSEVRHLAAFPINRVMGQINAATREGTPAQPISWASQPGMVRTYRSSGQPSQVYKLYSWDEISADGASFDPLSAAELPPHNWSSLPAVYVDLNAPVNGDYPVLDPAALGAVEGFSIDQSDPIVSSGSNPAPMPVKWLYVLQDGQMVAGTPSGSGEAQVSGATADNPIVGRVAFWTDDETSKVNINTASEGAFWDWPKAGTRDEMQFAGNPPVAGEYHRTPGHPAMTSLSAVFPELDPGDRWSDTGLYRQKLASIMEIAPKAIYSDSSSQGGTFPIESYGYDYSPANTFSDSLGAALLPDADRLYATAEELLFQPDRGKNPSITAADIKERGFFLTANSRAPETTLFGTPRLSLWPITWPWPAAHQQGNLRQVAAVSSPSPDTTDIEQNPWMRPEERLLALVSTLNRGSTDGEDRYFFQRQNPDSPTHDYASIQRNADLLSYLQKLTSTNVPGFGGNFAAKYGGLTRDTILANTFNLSRSLINQYTTVATPGEQKLLYSYTPVSFKTFYNKNGNKVRNYNETGAFSAMPLRLDLGSGEIQTLSEFPKLIEAALVFYATKRVDPVLKPSFNPSDPIDYSNPLNWDNMINLDPTDTVPDGAQTTEMRAVLMLDFSPTAGSSGKNRPIFWVKLAGDDSSANGTSLGLLGNATQINLGRPDFPSYLRSMFDFSGEDPVAKTFDSTTTSATNYSLISKPVSTLSTARNFPFNGGELKVEIYGLKDGDPNLDPTNDPALKIATYTIDFSDWNGSLPIPLAPRWNSYDKMNATGDAPNPLYNSVNIPSTTLNETTLNTRWAATEIAPLYRTGDVNSDPVKQSDPQKQATSPLNILFNTDPATGSINYPPDLDSDGDVVERWRRTVGYVYRHSGGELMTDFAERMNFFLDGVDSDYPPFKAESSGRPLIFLPPEYVFKPGGFPAITAYDTVISMVPDPDAPAQGDPRLAESFTFKRVNDVLTGGELREVFARSDYPRLNRQWHNLGGMNGDVAATGYNSFAANSLLGQGIAPRGMALNGAGTVGTVKVGRMGRDGTATGSASRADVFVGVRSAKPLGNIANQGSVGDWSSSPGNLADGGLITRADQDYQQIHRNQTGSVAQTPYFLDGGADTGVSGAYFSANRQLPSPITLLGQLPSSTSVGWQTLAFSPNPAAGSSHPGLANLPDHLLLDLFWMPVCEPYPISDQLSTAGKINLNYQILPFPYLERKTGLHALLKSTWMTALHNSLAEKYKAHFHVRDMTESQSRYPIDIDKTLAEVDQQIFEQGDLFRSASQICETPLVPEGETVSSLSSFWEDRLLTSDTAREQPYDHLYSRLTTKSNTFTVHWKVQALKKVPTTPPNTWVEGQDKVEAELAGSTLIERYVDPSADDIPDYATDFTADSIDHFYRWRVVTESYFRP